MVYDMEPEQLMNRSTLESAGMCLFFMLLLIGSMIFNGSVIISAILYRWKEVDNFTFVFCVSLSFNHLFIGFVIYPVISYSVVVNYWEPETFPCVLIAMMSSYLHTVYTLQIIVLLFDMAVVRYSDVRTMISVSLSKKIALNTWLVAAIPQIYPLLSIPHPYRYDPVQGGCFQTFIFRDAKTMFKCFGMYIVLPMFIIVIWYFILLFKEENNRRLAVTISRLMCQENRRPVRNYKTSFVLAIMFLITALPFVSCGLAGMKSFDIEKVPRQVREISNIWFSLSSVIIPIIYALTCPTYCKFVLPEKRWPWIYKRFAFISNITGCNSPDKLNNLSNVHGTVIMDPIVEVGEEEEGDYIELPAINITMHTNSLALPTFDR